MITKEITIAGKTVTIGYCYATEIAYKLNADEEITDFMLEAIPTIQQQRMPDAKKVMLLIIASITSYYESIKKDGEESKAPITDRDIMYDATSEEIGKALGDIITMRAEFYKMPNGEPQDKPKDGDDNPKNDYPPTITISYSLAK